MGMLNAKQQAESLEQTTRKQQQKRFNCNDEKWHLRGEFWVDKFYILCFSWKSGLVSVNLFKKFLGILQEFSENPILKLILSQEQLLEQQQLEQLELIRIAKLREIEKAKKLKFSERKFKGKNIREHSIFYTTVTLAFFSVSAGASILFLVPLYVGKRERKL